MTSLYKFHRQLWNNEKSISNLYIFNDIVKSKIYIYIFIGAVCGTTESRQHGRSQGAPSSRYRTAALRGPDAMPSNVFYTHSENTTLFYTLCWEHIDFGKNFETYLRAHSNNRAYNLYIIYSESRGESNLPCSSVATQSSLLVFKLSWWKFVNMPLITACCE